MKLKTLTLSNFARFDKSPQTVVFSDNETLIIGENNDTSGSNSNGSGKSSLLDGISWILFGDLMKNLEVQEVIRRGQDSCWGNLQLQDGDKLHIFERCQGLKKSLTYEVWQDNQKIEDFTRRTATQTQQEILNQLGLDPKKYFTDFSNIVYFSSEAVKGIASKELTNAERMQFITRFLNLNRFDLAAKAAKDLRDSNMASLDLVNSKINEILLKLPEGHSLTTYDKEISDRLISLNSSKEEWITYRGTLLEQKQTIGLIETLQAQIENLKEQKLQNDRIKERVTSLDIDIKNLQQQVIKKESELSEYASDDDYTTAISNVDKENIELEANLTQQRTQLSDLKRQLATPLRCPKCNAELSYYDQTLHTIDIEKLKGVQQQLLQLVKQLEESNKELRNKKKEYEDEWRQVVTEKFQFKAISETLSLQRKQKESLIINKTDFEAKISEIEAKIPVDIDTKQLEKDLKEAEEQLSGISEELGSLREIKKNITIWNKDLAEYKIEQQQYSTFVQSYDFWVKTFPQIKQAIIDNYLPIFETRTNYWLDFLNTGMTIRLRLEKELKSGGIKQEFGIIVIDEHGTEGSYDCCSQGEMRRIAVCIAMAMRDIAHSRNSLCFDFLMMDEVVDGLDETGISEFFKLLRNIRGQKLIISHNDDLKSLFSDVIKVVRKNGISYIKTAA